MESLSGPYGGIYDTSLSPLDSQPLGIFPMETGFSIHTSAPSDESFFFARGIYFYINQDSVKE